MNSSSTLLPRHHAPPVRDATSAADPRRRGGLGGASSDGDRASPGAGASGGSASRRRRRSALAARSKSKPLPSHDRLVVAFVAASALFAAVNVLPFLIGRFPADVGFEGRDLNLAANKTLLAWRRFAGRKEQEQPPGGAGEGRRSGSSVADEVGAKHLPLARGASGLPLSRTPALVGARHGSVRCPAADGRGEINMDELAYWNEPQGESDVSFASPFAPPPGRSDRRRYVTFEPDRGGWNNVRMSLEIVIVFAAATGRTLVLPPDTPFYLLSKKVEGKKTMPRHHGFADFLYLESEAMRKTVNMITMTEFLQLEGTNAGDVPSEEKMFSMPEGSEGQKIRKSAEQCYYVAKSDRPCDMIYSFLASAAYVPELNALKDCLVFDAERQSSKEVYTDAEILDLMPESERLRVKEFCEKRNVVFFGNELASAPLIHFHAGEKHHRLLSHFYTFLYFPDPKVDHYVKRFVRDFIHYTDIIWCAAGRVIQLLRNEAMELKISGNGTNDFSTLHARRGDFQYKKVKISAEDWYENTKDLFHPKEIIYVATDEKEKEFFEPMAASYNLRFLSDFSHAAGLDELDPNLMGMIDTIIASQGRLFVGTWFSTFTGYINRLRGYYGMAGNTSYYSTPDRKFNTHRWEKPSKVVTAREWPTAWVGIDGDELVSDERAGL